ncbi:Cyclin-H [Halotydeus destructor]|nr:Cyclin-H [Halotydeus destructor]
MFSVSTHKKFWMFTNKEELDQLRAEANGSFIAEHRQETNLPDERVYEYFLTVDEERMLFTQFQNILKEFCQKFKPPMPRTVVGTSLQYLKRFYLNNSVMNYHPKHVLVTCVYLACKVEEFNVSMTQFVANVRGDRVRAMDIVLSNELLLMQQLRYHLTVHNPYRPVEGLLIDLKTRCLTAGDPERFRPDIDDFIEKTYLTDAFLLFAPSQIALAAVVYAGAKNGVDLDSYLTDILLADAPNKIEHLSEVMKTLWNMIQAIESPDKGAVKAIDKKLETCRSQVNNPDSQEYKRANQDGGGGDEDEPVRKYVKLSQEQQRREDAYLESTSSRSSQSR